MNDQLIAEIISILGPAIGGLLLALLSWALAELTRYVRSRTKNEAINNAIARICHMTETVVADLNQRAVDGLKAAASDGKITADEAQALKDRAVAMVQLQLAPQVLDVARQGVADLTAFIASRVERAVREQHPNG